MMNDCSNLTLCEAYENDIAAGPDRTLWDVTQKRTKEQITIRGLEGLSAERMRKDWVKDLAQNAKLLAWFALVMALSALLWWAII